MKKLLPLLAVSTITLAGCNAGPQVKSFTGPTGEIVSTVRCTRDTAPCFEKASEQCGGGAYRVTNSYRNAGGLLADVFPGPVTWYTMSIVCGKPDGVMPNFPLRGVEPEMPPMPQSTINKPVNCTSHRVGSIVNTNCR